MNLSRNWQTHPMDKNARTTEQPTTHVPSSKPYEQCKQRGRLQRHLDENTPKHLSLGSANLMPKASRQPRKKRQKRISPTALYKIHGTKTKVVKLGRKYTTNIKRIKRENNETEQLKTTQKKRVSNWVLQNYMAPNQRIVETRTETHRMKTTNSHSDGSRTHLPLDLTKLHGTKTKL